MAMTRAQLLASLGAREITGDKAGVIRAVEDSGQGVRITGEVFWSRGPDCILAAITHQEAGGVAVRVCGLRADVQPDGLFPVTGFELGGVEYLQGDRWCLFNADSACGFVRAVMGELEAKRLPDLDALLTLVRGPDAFIAIEWRP